MNGVVERAEVLQALDPRKQRNHSIRCICVGEERPMVAE
jgi:hypothetical protein